MKLKVYPHPGADIEADITGDYNGAVVRSNCKGEVHVIINDTNLSRFLFQAIIGKPCPRKQFNISFIIRRSD